MVRAKKGKTMCVGHALQLHESDNLQAAQTDARAICRQIDEQGNAAAELPSSMSVRQHPARCSLGPAAAPSTAVLTT